MSKGFQLQYPCGSGVLLLVGLRVGYARGREKSSTKLRNFEKRALQQVVAAARRARTIAGTFAELPSQYIDAEGYAYSTNLPALQACSVQVPRPVAVPSGAMADEPPVRVVLKSSWNVEPVRRRIVEHSAQIRRHLCA